MGFQDKEETLQDVGFRKAREVELAEQSLCKAKHELSDEFGRKFMDTVLNNKYCPPMLNQAMALKEFTHINIESHYERQYLAFYSQRNELRFFVYLSQEDFKNTPQETAVDRQQIFDEAAIIGEVIHNYYEFDSLLRKYLGDNYDGNGKEYLIKCISVAFSSLSQALITDYLVEVVD